MENKIIVFSGPSGVGKATIERELFKDKDLKLSLSVSATTRSPREGEIDGEHYYFISREDFDKKIQDGMFVEWSEHFSNKYGTLKLELERIKENGMHPFLEVETNGAKNIISQFKKDEIISIFIAPPSIEAIRERIEKRGQETKLQIDERVARVEEELTHKNLFDYIVVNDDLEEAVSQVKQILKREFQ